MSEADWLASEHPVAMLEWVTGPVVELHALAGKASRDGARKLRLFACACARQACGEIGDKARLAIEAAARFADGEVGESYRRGGFSTFSHLPSPWERYLVQACCAPDAAQGAAEIAGIGRVFPSVNLTPVILADILRDIIGNPFARPLVINGGASGLAIRIAQDIYESRRFDELPVLADALEDTGCDSEELLTHLRATKTRLTCKRCRGRKAVQKFTRQPHDWRSRKHQLVETLIYCPDCAGTGWTEERAVVHTRGCWATDIVLGKD